MFQAYALSPTAVGAVAYNGPSPGGPGSGLSGAVGGGTTAEPFAADSPYFPFGTAISSGGVVRGIGPTAPGATTPSGGVVAAVGGGAHRQHSPIKGTRQQRVVTTPTVPGVITKDEPHTTSLDGHWVSAKISFIIELDEIRYVY